MRLLGRGSGLFFGFSGLVGGGVDQNRFLAAASRFLILLKIMWGGSSWQRPGLGGYKGTKATAERAEGFLSGKSS